MAEIRIVKKPLRDGRTNIFLYDPASGREVPTGLCPRTPEEIDRTIAKIKLEMERKRHHVTVKEM